MKGLDAWHLRTYVVEPALYRLHPHIPYSPQAVQLVTGTAIVESELQYLDQIDAAAKPGPAYGLWQMEHLSFNDHLERATLEIRDAIVKPYNFILDVSDLYWNLMLGAQMCRLLYWHAPERLPKPGDFEGMAHLWKLRYNTPKGAGTIEQALPGFKRACAL